MLLHSTFIFTFNIVVPIRKNLGITLLLSSVTFLSNLTQSLLLLQPLQMEADALEMH